MQSSPAAPSSPPVSSFAGLLAEFAFSERRTPPSRDGDGLEDDVATLSYEDALRSHTRYRRDEPDGAPGSAEAADEAQHRLDSVLRQNPASAAPAKWEEYVKGGRPEERKSASVTVRLSVPENERLRQRAAEAGMTISAYLRSCAFEVEALRAQVKEAVAELRQARREAAPSHSRSRLWPWRKRVRAGGES